jgi:LysR family hydrogen peroxide-inducible transcriptional activator
MVLSGAGVILMPQLAVPIEVRINDLRVRAFAEPAPSRTIGLIWRKHSPLGDALRQLSAALRSAYPDRAAKNSTLPPKRTSRTNRRAD